MDDYPGDGSEMTGPGIGNEYGRYGGYGYGPYGYSPWGYGMYPWGMGRESCRVATEWEYLAPTF